MLILEKFRHVPQQIVLFKTYNGQNKLLSKFNFRF